jgi:YafQ family addiction module toxin component
MFCFDLTDELKLKLYKLGKKDRLRAGIVNKKIREIISRDEETVEFYKNLRHDLKDYKRVHIDRNFVLVFKVDKERNFILFSDLDHHDNVYR